MNKIIGGGNPIRRLAVGKFCHILLGYKVIKQWHLRRVGHNKNIVRYRSNNILVGKYQLHKKWP